MIIEGYPDTSPRLNDTFCLGDILVGWHCVITGMIVRHDNGNCAEFNCVAENLARMYQSTVSRTERNDGRLTEKMPLRIKVQNKDVLLFFIYANRAYLTNYIIRRFNRTGK